MSWLSFYTPRNAVGGLYWIHPVCLSVCPSVRPSVCQLTFRVRPVASTVHDGFFPYLVQMIHSMRGCVACDDPWPWPISSRSFGLDLESRVHSVASTVLDGFFLYLAQMIIIIKGYVACHVFSCDQAALWMVFSVRLSHLFDYVPIIVSSWNFQELSHWTRVRSMQKFKVRGQRSRSQRSRQTFRFRTVTPVWIHIWWWNDTYRLMLLRRGALMFFKVIRQISRSHGAKIPEFDQDWAFPDCNSSLNSPMAMKCCTKLEVASKRCPIVFEGHPSNFKVTRL